MRNPFKDKQLEDEQEKDEDVIQYRLYMYTYIPPIIPRKKIILIDNLL